MTGKRAWWREIRHLVEGKDGRLSIRRILGVISFFTFIYIVIYGVKKCMQVQEGILWSLVALIGGFFTITTAQNIASEYMDNKKDKDEV